MGGATGPPRKSQLLRISLILVNYFLKLLKYLLFFQFLILGFPGGSDGKESACNAGDLGQSLGQEDPLENGMATHSSILA